MRFRSRHYIDLNLLEDNFKQLKKIAPKNEVIFMVKADAYGHGAIPIVRYVCSELGVKEFGCATLGEAIKLREELYDLEFEIYVFSDVQLALKECAEIYLNRRIIPVISNEDDFNFIISHPEFKRFPICLKFNTGMNRLGIDFEQVTDIADKLIAKGRKDIFHLLTHFSSASLSMKTNKRNNLQRERFKELKQILIDKGFSLERTSISNSGAIEQQFGLEETHIRPGLMMYGPTSLIPKYKDEGKWKGKIISRLETYIIRVFEVERGQPIGYGATPCPQEGVIAIIALGYGDGFSTRYLGAHINHNGQEGVIYGRVNMDMAQVFFPKAQLKDFKSGEKFTVWDHDTEHFNRFSLETKTIPYEIFIHLTTRVPKVYVK